MEKNCGDVSGAKTLANQLDSVSNEADVKQVAEKLSQEFVNITAGEDSPWLKTIIDQTFGKGIDPIAGEVDQNGKLSAIYISNPFKKEEALKISAGKVESVDRDPLESSLRLRREEQRANK